jgi:sialate O-acetylesterase
VKVATPAASYTPYDITITSGKEQAVLRNVLFGDVWFCGGQSNMAMPIKGMFNCAIDNAAEVIMKSGQNKGLRCVTVAQNQSL